MWEVAEKTEIRPLALALHGRPFASFPLHPELLKRLKALGLEKTTIIQDLFLPVALKGHDVIVKARRGSGKALAYLVVILDRLLRDPGTGVRALVLLTNEERARELAGLAEELAEGLPVTLTPFAAEEKIPEEQFRAVERGANLVFTTPYWLNRALKWRLFPTGGLKLIVLDEFDQMVEKGRGLIESLLKRLPPAGRRQGLVFMENLSYEALELAYQFLQDPDELYLELGRQDFSPIKLSLLHVSEEEKFSLLLGVLAQHGWPKSIVFVNNKIEAQKLCDELKKLGIPTVFLKPDLGPELRLHFLKQFARGEARILVATDAGCRFIHEKDIKLVVNYDLPETADEFRQRAAKVCEGGLLVSFCDEEGAFFLEGIEKELGLKLPVVFPEPEEEWFLSPSLAREKFSRFRPQRPKRRTPSRARRPRR